MSAMDDELSEQQSDMLCTAFTECIKGIIV